MNLYLEYGGGLGDVINLLFYNNSYNLLHDLKPGERARIALICHNPYANELFKWHPKAAQIEVIDYGYWNPDYDHVRRREEHLPPAGALDFLPRSPEPGNLRFYPSPGDIEILERLRGSYYVTIAANASSPDRDLPWDTVARSVASLQARNITPVFTGRNYDLFFHRELSNLERLGNVVNLIDKLSVPGTFELVRGSLGQVTCHSALSILGGRLRKPQLLLYSEEARQNCFLRPSRYRAGADHGTTVHGIFKEYSSAMQSRFEDMFLTNEHHRTNSGNAQRCLAGSLGD